MWRTEEAGLTGGFGIATAKDEYSILLELVDGRKLRKEKENDMKSSRNLPNAEFAASGLGQELY